MYVLWVFLCCLWASNLQESNYFHYVRVNNVIRLWMVIIYEKKLQYIIAILPILDWYRISMSLRKTQQTLRKVSIISMIIMSALKLYCTLQYVSSDITCHCGKTKARINFFYFLRNNPALAPHLCRPICLIGKKGEVDLFQTTLLSVWTRLSGGAHPGCEQGPEAWVTPADFSVNRKQVFAAPLLWWEKSVVWIRTHPVLIPLCLISEQKSISSSCRQQLITALSFCAKPCVRKAFFLSLWIQLKPSIRMTDEVFSPK